MTLRKVLGEAGSFVWAFKKGQLPPYTTVTSEWVIEGFGIYNFCDFYQIPGGAIGLELGFAQVSIGPGSKSIKHVILLIGEAIIYIDEARTYVLSLEGE